MSEYKSAVVHSGSKPPHKPVPVSERIARKVWPVVSIGTVAFATAGPVHGVVDGVSHNPTAQEAAIEAALSPDAETRPKVRCLSYEEMFNRSPANLFTDGIRIGERPFFSFWLGDDVMWLDELVCDNISGMSSKPPKTIQDITEFQIVSLSTAAHEYEHIRGSHDEGVTECRMIQTIGGFAGRVGVPEYLEDDITSAALGLHDEKLVKWAPNYAFDEQCYPGGENDLGLYAPGAFPIARQ